MRHDGELAEIRGLLAGELDGAIGSGMRTVDLVRGLLKVAHRTHGTVEAVRRRLLACGIGNRPSVVTMCATACSELIALRESSSLAALSGGGEESAKILALLEAAVAKGAVDVRPGAAAGFREAMTGESGAVEVALTAHEVTDLVLSGVAFTEVGDGAGEDVLLKLVDTTGWLRQLHPAVTAREVMRGVSGPEGQRGQQQPDRRAVSREGEAAPLPEGENGDGDERSE